MPGNKRSKRKSGKKRVKKALPGEGQQDGGKGGVPGAKATQKSYGPQKGSRAGFTPAIVRRSQRGK